MDGNWSHICVDMQRMFAEDTPWHVGWMDTILPAMSEVARRHAARTIFTRFVPPQHADAAPGMWKPYYEKWWMMTGEHLPPEMLDLIAPLARTLPPATTLDKHTYSPWMDGRLHAALAGRNIRRLVITGGETDVCVLATVLGAVDLGYDVTLLDDAVCSGTDATHDAALGLLKTRYSSQLRAMSTEAFLSLS
ncbi:Nicotinamidase-related amidase [Rhizobium sp. RU20A]|uniref:cysteine hydrolase family protein n=1 Tax=Rhizobium sp. RU20A TaxID=1907412 RepID=UPI000956C907|nr:isochorismatase family cysteine hydrolase [Rhizobium sp. RU20A]SIQ18728.1 Nicotinamidase-related amidase [Rhizobium sp. RU20A]